MLWELHPGVPMLKKKKNECNEKQVSWAPFHGVAWLCAEFGSLGLYSILILKCAQKNVALIQFACWYSSKVGDSYREVMTSRSNVDSTLFGDNTVRPQPCPVACLRKPKTVG